MFKELSKQKTSEREQEITNEWKENRVFEKSIENREGKENFVFYDGPIYANAKPGIHHVFSKAIKDAFCRYKTMQGYKVDRKIGLDCNGLPIEYNVEKKLGIDGKKAIEELGIDKFIEECKKNTALNIDEVNKVTDMMGQFIDQENPYITCVNDYHETEWYLLKEMHKKGAIYQSNKVLPYCPRCGTELAKFEVDQGYQKDSVNTVIVPFKIVDKDEYMLVWTTTPWTLIDNVVACVNPDLTYVKVESMGYKFILAESLADSVLGEGYTVFEKFKGTDLVGTRYEQLLPFAKIENGDSFVVIADSYVTSEDGTGIVHIAPAYGEDDNRVCKENGIGWVQSVDLNGKYTVGPWKGRLVTDSELELEIVKYLKENDKLFKKIKIEHDYPHCWRCKSPLIYYSKPAWYIKCTDYKDKIIEQNNKVNWYPSFVGEKRFGNWLENMVDWGISRNRYWGCPLPFWVCEECKHFDVIGSREELIERADQDLKYEDIDLHRPYVDNITMKCPKCGKTMHRIEDVIDVWFDSGAMPYAQCHYTFENKEWFERHFPGDFIAEGVDQTRGWFYTLIVISTMISGVSSFKNVVVNDMMLDAYGKKMSKSTGNIIDPVEVMEEYGADPIRWYMMMVSPVWTPLKFDINGVKEVNSKFFSTLKNTYNFFAMYANADKLDVKDFENATDYEEIDKWLLSKYNNLVKVVTEAYEEYDLNKVVKPITEFVSEDLSNWYIRRNRRRFWKGELDSSKLAVYKVTYDVLVGLTKLIAPVSPFISEDIYKNLTGNESVHLSDFPKVDESIINERIENRMDLVRDLISLGRNAREEANIKIRQPLSKVLLDAKNESLISDLSDLIKEELNVKEVVFTSEFNEYLEYNVKPNFKEVGKLLGKDVNEFAKIVSTFTMDDVNSVEGKVVEVAGKEYTLTKDMLDVRVLSKEGYDAVSDSVNFIILDTTITEELKYEGILRDLIRQCQLIRKNAGLDISDRINISINTTEEITNNVINKYKEEIESELLATLVSELETESILFTDEENNEYEIKIEKK